MNRLQEIFDKVANHLLTQNKRSTSSSDEYAILPMGCKYRFNGLKCAAGYLISDEDYSPEMEGHTVTDLDFFKSNYNSVELNLIEELQNLHDKFPVKLWKSYLQHIAARRNLTWSCGTKA